MRKITLTIEDNLKYVLEQISLDYGVSQADIIRHAIKYYTEKVCDGEIQITVMPHIEADPATG